MSDTEPLARDPEHDDDLVDWWIYDEGLEDETEVVCEDDEVVLFVAAGRVVAQLGPGEHTVTADDFPALAPFIGDGADHVDVGFVRVANFTLGLADPLGTLTDPQTNTAADTWVVGSAALVVRTPKELLAITTASSDTPPEEFLRLRLLGLTRDAVGEYFVKNKLFPDGSPLPEPLIAALEKRVNEAFAVLAVTVTIDRDLCVVDEDPTEDEEGDDEDEESDDEG